MAAQKLKPVDVVVIGLGAGGGTAVWPLANAGLKVVGLEAGPRVSIKDYPFDEVRNDLRDHMGRFKSNLEFPTWRLNEKLPATRPVGATGPMMNAVGGTSIHWMTQSWRFLPWNFKSRTEITKRYGAGAIPKGTTLQDWPFDYDELEPYYDRLEYRHGVSGQAGNLKGKVDPRGNVFEGPRRRPYPLKPLRNSGWTTMMYDAAKASGYKPYPGPAGIRSEAYNGFPGCAYCGFCGWTGCYTNAKAQTNIHFIPQAEATKNLTVVPRARVTKIEVGSDGMVTGVTYVKNRTTYFQPAKAVLVGAYMYENVRLALISKSKAFPNGLSNNAGQVGRHYISHGSGAASVSGLFPGKRLGRYTGTIGQYTAVDDFDGDNFDHSGLGFVSGGMCSATMEGKPIGTANTIPPGAPRWGSDYKTWLSQYADSVGTASAQLEVFSYEQNYVDLDPTVKDPMGIPVIRVTFDLTDNERRAALYIQKKLDAWLKAAGASQTWTTPPAPRGINTHAYGGTRAGDDKDTNVTDRWGMSHEVPNLGFLGGSTFSTTGGRNPTETIQATAWRTADHVVKAWKDIAG